MLTLDRQELGKIDRARLLERFALAERHVREGARHVARQREIVAQLKGRGAKPPFMPPVPVYVRS